MSKTGGSFEPCKVGSVELHNERASEYLASVVKSGRNLYFFQNLTNNNESWLAPEYQEKKCRQIYDDLVTLYKEKVGQAPQFKERVVTTKKGTKKRIAGWSPIREAAIPIMADTRIADFEKVFSWLRMKGWKPIRCDLHKDEGYRDPVSGHINMNYHAHLVVNCIDENTGRSVKLDKFDMSDFQTILADALGMERGIPKSKTGLDHLVPIEWKEQKAAEHLVELNEQEKEKEKKIVELQGKIASLDAQLQQKKSNLAFGANLLKFWWIRERSVSKDVTEKLGMKIEGKADTVWISGVPQKVAREIGDDKSKLLNAFLDKIIRIPERIEKIIGIKR